MFNVGIDPYEGFALAFHDSNKTTKKIKLNSVKENEIHNVDEMFKQIKAKIDGPLGCVCLCLFVDYGNQIRKQFIKSGISAGFMKVEIIDWVTAGYLIAISQATPYKPTNGDAIWIFNENFYYVWQISSKKAKHISFHGFNSNETFERVTKTSKLKKNPTVIIYHNKMDRSFFNSIPMTCKLFPYEFQSLETAALMKARIAANDSEVIKFDVNAILGQDIMFRIDKTEIFNLKLNEMLPIVKQLPIKKLAGQETLQIIQNNKIEESISLAQNDNFVFDLKIDTNGIYTTKCLELLKPKTVTDSLSTETTECVGVDLSRGEVSTFNINSEQKKSVSLTINLSMSNVAEKIKLALQEIKVKYVKDCIIVFHVDDDSFNSVLIDYLTTCQNFQNVSFISTQTAEILNILNEHPLEASIQTIAFISDRIEKRKLYCQTWKKYDNVFKPYQSYFRDSNSGDDEGNLTKLFHDSNGLNNIDKIFYDSLIDRKVFEKIFSNKKDLIPIEYRPAYSEAALLYAESIANLNKPKRLQVENCLNRRFTLIVNDENVFNSQMGTALPIVKNFKFNGIIIKSIKICERNASGRKHESELNLSTKEPKNYVLGICCNTNGIVSLSIISENSSHVVVPESIGITEKEKKLMLLSKLLENDADLLLNSEQILYTFPKKVMSSENNFNFNVVGIDLGTSRCCAAVNRNHGIETVAIENTGERLLPSYVAYDEETEKCGQIAVNRLQNFAKSTIFDVKRIIGKHFEDIIIDPIWPFKIIQADKLGIQRSWNSKFLEQSDVFIEIEVDQKKVFKTPEDVSAALLKHIKKRAEQFQGTLLTEAVITIPAVFTKSQKIATYVAGLQAGWSKVRLLPEPVAAAFAYFVDRPLPNNSTLLLFDLGGGTLDVCIFKINQKKLEIVSHTGDSNLGGRNFDNLLMHYFSDILKRDFDILISEKNRYKLMLKCQEIKHNLTVIEKERLEIENFDLRIEDVIHVSRQQFEEMSHKLLQRVIKTIHSALNQIKHSTKQIDKVLYVGGGCRMPMIQKMLKEIFPYSEHCREEHPDEVVAVGAAYYANFLKTDDRNESRCSLM